MYTVYESDGIGQINEHRGLYNSDEIIELLPFGTEFKPDGDNVITSEYNAGSDSMPSWRTNNLIYEPWDGDVETEEFPF